MKLISNWREAWRMNSVQVFALLAFVPMIWDELPEEVKAIIPEDWRPYVVAVVALVGMILRLRDQTGRGTGR